MVEPKSLQNSKNYFYLHLREIPYFRALVRSVEAGFYQQMDCCLPLLDLGCGDGHFASVAFDWKVDVGVDPWRQPMLEARRRGAYRFLVQSDGGRIPFANGFFGSAISNSVLEHIPYIEQVLSEVNRVLKPGAQFIFCVPNPGYLEELSFPLIFRFLSLPRLGEWYRNWFRRMSRVEHAVPVDTWKMWLENAGFILEKSWDYFSPQALRVLEWGHFFGLPSLICKKIFGRWLIASARWNVIPIELLLRRYTDSVPHPQGTFTFYVARKKNSG